MENLTIYEFNSLLLHYSIHTMPGDKDIYKIATFLSLCASLTYANDAKISLRFIDSSFPLFHQIHTYFHVLSITLLISKGKIKVSDFYLEMSIKFLVENLGQAAHILICWDATKMIGFRSVEKAKISNLDIILGASQKSSCFWA